MSSESKVIFSCNLCHNKKESGSALPSGWLNFLIEDKYVDRSFDERHICPDCVKDILIRSNKGENHA